MGFSNTLKVITTNLWDNRQPVYTEKDYPDLKGKIFVVTGGASGIGFEVSKFLLSKNAKVYVVGRNQQKINDGIAKLKQEGPNATVDYFLVDYNDLNTVKPGVQRFLDRETRLDCVIHNAGIMSMNRSETKQGFEVHLGVNAIGTWALQKCLDDILIQTAKTVPENSLRIVWVTSNGHYGSFDDKGINWNDINYKTEWSLQAAYGQSKAINIYESILWAKKHPGSGVVSLSVHPGPIRSEITRDLGSTTQKILSKLFFYETKYGAYSELYPALHPQFTVKDNGTYITPFGHVGQARADVVEGANGENGEKLYKFLEEQTRSYV